MKTLKSILTITAIFLCINYVKAATSELTNSLNAVTKTYLDIKNALVANNAAEAETKAGEMAKVIGAVPEKDMTPEQHKVWTEYVNKLLFDSRHMSEHNPIDHKREHFASLSTNMFAVLKAFNLNTMVLYKQYCPMKKTYWVSENAAIKNPYYGTGSMATCGSTKETLKVR